MPRTGVTAGRCRQPASDGAPASLADYRNGQDTGKDHEKHACRDRRRRYVARKIYAFVTGHGCYSDDFNFPGQAYGAVLRSPHAHALIRSIDTAEASAMPGVLAVLTGEDARTDGLKAHPPSGRAGDRTRHRAAQPRRLAGAGRPTPRSFRRIGSAMSAPPSPSSIAETVAAAKDAAETYRRRIRAVADGDRRQGRGRGTAPRGFTTICRIS